MNVVGKTLVILILVLAVAQAALHVMFHVTQTNWKDSYQKLEAQYRTLSAETTALQGERDEAADKSAKQVAAVEARVKEAQDQLEQSKAQLAALQGQLQAEREKVTRSDANVASSNSDISRRQEEVRRLEETVKADEKRVADLVDTANQLRDRAVAAEIESRSLKERNNNLVAKLEEMSKEVARAKSGGAGGTTLTPKNPPPENVEAMVTKTDTSGLLTLSAGSDDGLQKGHTLEVFRLSPAKYLGTVRVIQVTPHEAVAQPVSRPLGPIQPGDRVASKILGS